MGEMTIRNIDEALLVELTDRAAREGVEISDFVAGLIRQGLRHRGRADGSRAILASQPTCAERDSLELLRDERNRR